MMKENYKVIKVHPSDNVIVALEDIPAGAGISYENETYQIVDDIAAKHKFYQSDMQPGDTVTMYGVLVGKVQIPVTAGGFVDGGGGNATDIDDITQPRVPGTDTLAAAGGNSTKAIAVRNLPDHVHDLQADDRQFYTVRNDTAITPSAVPGLGPTAVAQTPYLNDSGGVKSAEDLGQRFNVMNPYLVINYIIRSGPSEFETVSN
jgi:hypothetical protein